MAKTVNSNQVLAMFITKQNELYFISKTESPYSVWYAINLNIPLYGEDYVKSKLGVTDPIQQRDLRIEFYEAIRNAEIRTDEVEYHVLRFDNTDYPIYLYQEYANVITVFMEKGLFTLGENRPGGYPWATIYKTDTPEIIQVKLYDHRKRFGIAMHKKLKKIMGW